MPYVQLVRILAILIALGMLVAWSQDPGPSAELESPWPLADDVATPESVVAATYTSINRAPGDPYQWERFHSLFLPGAQLISNVRQTGGKFQPLSPKGFQEWIERAGPPGGPGDRGFAEEQVWAETRRYGVVASVLSTYQKRFWDDERVLGRGINCFQLVKHEDRWWVTSLIWDEEPDAGPIPPEFGGVAREDKAREDKAPEDGVPRERAPK